MQQPPGQPPHGQPPQPPQPPQPQQQQQYPQQQQGYPQQPQQGYAQQQPQPQQQGQQMVQQGTSGLQVHTSFIFLQWMFLFVQPRVVVNGQEHKVPWGTQFAPLPPGDYHVKIYVPWMLGPACKSETQIRVEPGHITHLAYKTAFFVFQSGSLTNKGTQPMTA